MASPGHRWSKALKRERSQGARTQWLPLVLPTLLSLLSSVAVLVIGYWLTESVKQSLAGQELQLKSQQAQLAEAQAVKTFVDAMLDPSARPEDQVLAAQTLSVHGRAAIASLVVFLYDPPPRADAALEGLRRVGLLEPRSVCERLGVAVTARPTAEGYTGTVFALGLLGELGCTPEFLRLPNFEPLVRHWMTTGLQISDTQARQIVAAYDTMRTTLLVHNGIFGR